MCREYLLSIGFLTSLASAQQPTLDHLIALTSISTVHEFDSATSGMGFRYKNIVRLRPEAEKDTAYVEMIYTDGRTTAPNADLLGLLLMGGWTPKVYLSSAVDMGPMTRDYANAQGFRPTSDCLALQDPRSSRCECWTDGAFVLYHCQNPPTPEGHRFALWVYTLER